MLGLSSFFQDIASTFNGIVPLWRSDDALENNNQAREKR